MKFRVSYGILEGLNPPRNPVKAYELKTPKQFIFYESGFKATISAECCLLESTFVVSRNGFMFNYRPIHCLLRLKIFLHSPIFTYIMQV